MAAPIITPAADALDGKEVQLFTANQACTWETDGGTLYNNAAATSLYAGGLQTQVYLKAINVTGGYGLTATNAGAESTVADFTVMGVCPSHPSWKFRGEYDSVFLTFTPDSGPADRQEREKRPLKYRCDFQAGARQRAEFVEFLAFFTAHRGKNKNFKFTHVGTSAVYTCYFAAPLAEEWELVNLVGCSTVIQEV